MARAEPIDVFDEFKEYLESMEYTDVVIKNGRICGLYRFAFSTGLLADMYDTGYGERWCYHTMAEAKLALEEWDGVDEPTGWHRHVSSGRRRDKDGNDIGRW